MPTMVTATDPILKSLAELSAYPMQKVELLELRAAVRHWYQWREFQVSQHNKATPQETERIRVEHQARRTRLEDAKARFDLIGSDAVVAWVNKNSRLF